MEGKRTTNLEKGHVECHAGAFFIVKSNYHHFRNEFNLHCAYMYAGYLVKMSSEVKCPNVTPKSNQEIGNVI